MGLLTKREECISRIDAAPYAVTAVLNRIKSGYKVYNLNQLMLDLQGAQHTLDQVRSALLYLKNVTEA